MDSIVSLRTDALCFHLQIQIWASSFYFKSTIGLGEFLRATFSMPVKWIKICNKANCSEMEKNVQIISIFRKSLYFKLLRCLCQVNTIHRRYEGSLNTAVFGGTVLKMESIKKCPKWLVTCSQIVKIGIIC